MSIYEIREIFDATGDHLKNEVVNVQEEYHQITEQLKKIQSKDKNAFSSLIEKLDPSSLENNQQDVPEYLK